MIISHYSNNMLGSSSTDSASVTKSTIASDKSQPQLSSSGLKTQQATADPAQGLPQGAAIKQTSVSATEATTHQASDKQRLESDALISRDLAQRDREVKNHERIHASIGGAFTSAPNFSYQKGPDGQLYAVAGEVRIDTSAVSGDPRATLEKAQVIIRAALSVPEPSVQDKRVAAQARAMANEASIEIAKLEKPLEDSLSNRLEGKLGNGFDDALEKDSKKSSEKVITEPADDNAVDVLQSQQNSAVSTDKQAKDDQEDKESADKPSVAERNAEIASLSQLTNESLQESNNRLNNINKTLHDINLRLVQTGVFEKLFPEGSIIDKNV